MVYDNLEYIDEHTAIVKKPIVCMGSEPLPDMTPDELRTWYAANHTERGLAAAYAAASNKAWWVEDEIYDYEEGTSERENAVAICHAWFAVMDEFKSVIHDVLRSEGVEIPERGQIVVEIPFMERNGYEDGCGWWVKKAASEDLK